MAVRKSISFSDQHDEWMKVQIASGQYNSESEIIRDLIRHARQRADEVERIRDALFARFQQLTETPQLYPAVDHILKRIRFTTG